MPASCHPSKAIHRSARQYPVPHRLVLELAADTVGMAAGLGLRLRLRLLLRCRETPGRAKAARGASRRTAADFASRWIGKRKPRMRTWEAAASRHVFSTCHGCSIGWNCFPPEVVLVRRCFDTVPSASGCGVVRLGGIRTIQRFLKRKRQPQEITI